MENKKEQEKSDVARREEDVLAFWNEHHIFEKTVETPAGNAPVGDFVFYDGPPFATGTPHYGHILAGTMKDAIPRFWTMNGKRVVRKWGWDCHGLPLENIIEKRLGLSTKRDIEEMGVKQFNEAARNAVMEYESDWKEVVARMGRFVDMEHDYKTMDSSYTESVWWALSELNRKGLLYEGFKSMHLCPRCGTTLSNFEVNLGYKDIKDIAVTVKMPLLDDRGGKTDTSLLIWTTTPWTLPGNMAIAVNRAITYVKVRMQFDKNEECVLLAKERLSQLGTDTYVILEEMKGDVLVGKKYVPPFDSIFTQEIKDTEKAWKVYHADYVSTEDGTGAVHIAPAYGEEDLELAKREGIPIVHHVDSDGRFKSFVPHLSGQLVKPKDDDKADVSHIDADIEIIKLLKEYGVLVHKENITHSYPHCWRCDTPLLNYATTSWFVKVTNLKDALVEENNRICWVPEHVGSNRFGKWLEGARDWAISRQRYWGAPIPIWKRKDSNEYRVVGSLAELQSYVPKSGNTFFIMRHGEAELYAQGVLNGVLGIPNALTEHGKEQVHASIDAIRSGGIDYIYYSPLERTTETAHIVAEVLGVSEEYLIADERLREMQFGIFEGKQVDDYHAFFGSGINRLRIAPDGGETWNDVRRRIGEFLYEIQSAHVGKKILIVSHNGPLQVLQANARGDDTKTFGAHIDKNTYDLTPAEVRQVAFTPMPHNDLYELDFHRPYIDEIELFDADGTSLERVLDVFDCWFESGAMPFAEYHYPFEHKEEFLPSMYPAQFIAEGLDQTRGWFYSLLVLGTALFGKAPYEHVIVNGLTLAEDGKKMSKSLHNYPDPMELADRVGVDALRYYLLSSPIVRGEDLRVSEKEVLELQRKNIGRLHNVLALYELFADGRVHANTNATNVLDRWVLARLNEVIHEVTEGYTNYELDRATRPLEGFIDDLSVWYVRRSRDRLKGEDIADKEACLATLRHVLTELSKLMAPVMPFYSEYLFQHVRHIDDRESVHLTSWPKEGSTDPVVLGEMNMVREFVTLALEARTKANCKVRQPLSTLYMNVEMDPSYTAIIAGEINVKEVVFDVTLEERVRLDTSITPSLKREGDVRELMRAVQDARKEMGLKPEDRIVLVLDVAGHTLIEPFVREVQRTVGAREVCTDATRTTRVCTIDSTTFRFGIEVI